MTNGFFIFCLQCFITVDVQAVKDLASASASIQRGNSRNSVIPQFQRSSVATSQKSFCNLRLLVLMILLASTSWKNHQGRENKIMCLFITLLSVAGLAVGSCTLMTPDCVYFAEPNLILWVLIVFAYSLYIFVSLIVHLSLFSKKEMTNTSRTLYSLL